GYSRQRSGGPEGGAWLRNTRSSRAAANLREIARYLLSARYRSASPEIFYRPARSGCFHRVQPGLSMGLCLLQRVDVLRSQLPREDTGALSRGTGTSSRAGNFYCGRRSLHSSRARYAAWRSDCPPRNQETLLSRNARRCALAQQEGLRTLEATWPEYHVPRS